MLLLETIAEQLEKQLVEVVAAELGVAMAGQHFDDALLRLHDRHVESAAAQVVDEQAAHLAVRRIVGQRRGRRLVEDAHFGETGEFTGLDCRLSLRVVEERRHGDHGFLNDIAELRFRALLESAQDHGGDLLRPIFLVAELDLDVLPHLPLDRLDGALGSQDPLVPSRLADQQASVFGKAHERGQDRVAVLGENDWLAVAQHRHFAIGRAEVDADNHLGRGGGIHHVPFS